MANDDERDSGGSTLRLSNPTTSTTGEKTSSCSKRMITTDLKNRPRGWIPLGYPRPIPQENHSFFPLHKDVLLALVRHLLILDGTICGKTLLVNLQHDAYLRHVGIKVDKDVVAPVTVKQEVVKEEKTTMKKRIREEVPVDVDKFISDNNKKKYNSSNTSNSQKSLMQYNDGDISSRTFCKTTLKRTNNTEHKQKMSLKSTLSRKPIKRKGTIIRPPTFNPSSSNDDSSPRQQYPKSEPRKRRKITLPDVTSSSHISNPNSNSLHSRKEPAVIIIEDDSEEERRKKNILTAEEIAWKIVIRALPRSEDDKCHGCDCRHNSGDASSIVPDICLSKSSHDDPVEKYNEENDEVVVCGSTTSSGLDKPPHIKSGRNPRKVSDADTYYATNNPVACLVQQPQDYTIISPSSFFNDVSSTSNNNGTNNLISLSMEQEMRLRQLSHMRLLRLLSTFEISTIKEFLNVKHPPSSHPHTLIKKLCTTIFNASHALYAFEQTEVDLGVGQTTALLSPALFRWESDGHIQKMLFDSKTLNKIGGFDDTNVVPQALGISRMRREGMKWERFAKTGVGRRILNKILHRHWAWKRQQKKRTREVKQHGATVAVAGGRRRGYYLVSDAIEKDDGYLKDGFVCPKCIKKQPPSTNDGSCNDDDDNVAMSSSETKNGGPDNEVSEATAESSSIASMLLPSPLEDGILSFHLIRTSSCDDWGITLSREGSMCVVLESSYNNNGELKEGDVVLSVDDEAGERLWCAPPSSSLFTMVGGTSASAETRWFKELVHLFKMRTVLHVRVRRVLGVSA